MKIKKSQWRAKAQLELLTEKILSRFHKIPIGSISRCFFFCPVCMVAPDTILSEESNTNP